MMADPEEGDSFTDFEKLSNLLPQIRYKNLHSEVCPINASDKLTEIKQ